MEYFSKGSREKLLDSDSALCDKCLKLKVMGFHVSAWAGKTSALLIFELSVMVNSELVSDQQTDEVCGFHEQIVRCQGFAQACSRWMFGERWVNCLF